MQVPFYSTVDLSASAYVGGDFSIYSRQSLGNLRAIGMIEAQDDISTVKAWGGVVEVPYSVPAPPKEISFLVNVNRADWTAGQPLPTLWKSRTSRVCWITIKGSADDTGRVIPFVCRPHRWTLSLSTSEITLIDCSVLVLSKIEPELLNVS